MTLLKNSVTNISSHMLEMAALTSYNL